MQRLPLHRQRRNHALDASLFHIQPGKHDLNRLRASGQSLITALPRQRRNALQAPLLVRDAAHHLVAPARQSLFPAAVGALPRRPCYRDFGLEFF